MKVKKWVNGALILDGDIKDGAKEAFREMRYVEAFALVQALIDWWMANMCQRHLSWVKGKDSHEVYFTTKYVFPYLRKYLLENEIITQKESGELVEFYELRNRIIHRLLIHSYQPNDRRNQVTPTEARLGFRKGMDLVHLLERRTTSAKLFESNEKSGGPSARAANPDLVVQIQKL